jgi:predicted NUDIX family phosphoesterase
MEFVYVVPRTSLFPEFYPHGIVPFGTGMPLEGFESVVEQEGFFVERAYAERTPSLKQVIPYSIVECDGKILLLRRLSAGGEARLHDKLSIGVGGHVNPEDLPPEDRRRDPISAGSDREIAEELEIRGEYKVRRVGILNDDSNAVGAVHVGVVQIVTVLGTVAIREKDQLEGRLVTPDELHKLHAEGANFETWSRLLIESEVLPQHAVAAS